MYPLGQNFSVCGQICGQRKYAKNQNGEKVQKEKRNGLKPAVSVRFFGGDYRTRICDLLRVKIRRDENRVLFVPFGAELSDKMSGWSLPCPMAPSAHFGVWVDVWVRRRLHRSFELC